MADDDNESLSADEAAYFENRGEKTDTAPAASEPSHVEEADDADIEEFDETDPQPEAEGKNKTVPHQALHKERLRRQKVEKERQELRERYARLEERTNLITQAIQAQNRPEPAKPPAIEEDPIAVIRNLEQRTAAQEQRAQQEEAQRREAEQISTIDNTYRGDWQRFAQAKPDATDAYNHFTKTLAAHFQLRGANPQQVSALVANEERQIAVAAFQQGKSPAELIYAQAQLYGYQPKAAASTDDGTAAEQVERRKAALPAARSLSNTGGSANSPTPTPEQIANMSEDAFAEFYNKLSPAKRERLLGAS